MDQDIRSRLGGSVEARLVELDEPQTLVCPEHWEEIGPYCPTIIGMETWMRIWTGLAHGELMAVKEFRQAVEEEDVATLVKWMPACCKLPWEVRQRLLAKTIGICVEGLQMDNRLPYA